MKISELIEQLPIVLRHGNADTEVKDIVSDSRKAGPGTLFAALPGANDKALDGHDFIPNAFEQGCRVFLVSKTPEDFISKENIVILEAHDTRHALALLSRRFFGYPENRLKLIALTGTKGKTTISYMLRNIFEKVGKKVGMIGSNGIMYPGFSKLLPNTTPEPYIIHGYLKDMADAGVEYCFLEATSQGFMMSRTDGIEFDMALFTNISPDHISKTEHPSFEHYFECKKRVFSQTDIAYVNRDAELFDEIIKDVPEDMIHVYGLSNEDGGLEKLGDKYPISYMAKDVSLARDGNRLKVDFMCVAPHWEKRISVGAPGKHNAENALGAICIADRYGISPDDIAAGLTQVSVEGRMEYVDVPAPYTVIIDYAHNKLSMEAMMSTAKAYNPNHILCVFGLDSGRAIIRRAHCGEVLGRDADFTILSDTSPKTEDPFKIMAAIAEGIESGGGAGKYEMIRDRKVSIPKILDMAGEGDIVLIVGQGNRTYQDIEGEIVRLDEREIINEYFNNKNLTQNRTVKTDD